MTQADFIEVLSFLSGSYALGWVSGFLIRFFTQMSEKI